MKRTSTIVLLAGVALGNVAFAQSNATARTRLS